MATGENKTMETAADVAAYLDTVAVSYTHL